MDEFNDKSSRFEIFDENQIISDRTYNTVLGGTILWGILINIIMCMIFKDSIRFWNPVILLIVYFVMCIAGILISRYSSNALVSFLGYNMVVIPCGLVLSSVIEQYARSDAKLILLAFIYTFIITFIMIGLSVAFPGFFSKIGGILLTSLIGILIAGIVNLIIGFNSGLYSFFGAVVFSLYIGYDFLRSQQYVKTYDNAVDSAVDIYLDIINLFLKILSLLSKRKD